MEDVTCYVTCYCWVGFSEAIQNSMDYRREFLGFSCNRNMENLSVFCNGTKIPFSKKAQATLQLHTKYYLNDINFREIFFSWFLEN